MDSNLISLSKLFSEKIFRIPDYQRGYAWGNKQLRDFWNDLEQLEKDKNHYVGVLTLEPVSDSIYNNWNDDVWIVEHKSFIPYYVVDGQQRLTTSIILIQAIVEISIEKKIDALNFSTINEIKKKYIFDSKDVSNLSRSYIFGYEKDNPSYEYLKTKIFNEHSETNHNKQETIYTQNLKNAKQFFIDKLSGLDVTEIEYCFKKLSQNFYFNIFTITSDVDTYVSFETMNNRGKALSYLELLKNRLIYLSTKLNNDSCDIVSLRKKINECWKSIYHNLGKNQLKQLDDDEFLTSHYMIYFGKELFKTTENGNYNVHPFLIKRQFLSNNSFYLLDSKFTTKSLFEGTLNINNINSYVSNLQESVEVWYALFNPYDNQFDRQTQELLEKINRSYLHLATPLMLFFFKREVDQKTRIKFLESLERLFFIFSLINIQYYLFDEHGFNAINMAIKLNDGTLDQNSVIKRIDECSNNIINDPSFTETLVKKFKDKGFYDWDNIRYFLFEYNLHLTQNSKTDRKKLNWEFLNSEDYKTIEHIYPQNSRNDCWNNDYKLFNSVQKRKLKNSLGNLLPLSSPKNAALSNKCFDLKVGIKESSVGYRYGCYAENEITEKTSWTPNDILERGIKLLNFLEKRWKIKLGSEDIKKRILGLEFL